MEHKWPNPILTGTELRAQRERAGVSIVDLAGVIRMHPNTLGRVERGVLPLKAHHGMCAAFVFDFMHRNGLDTPDILELEKRRKAAAPASAPVPAKTPLHRWVNAARQPLRNDPVTDLDPGTAYWECVVHPDGSNGPWRQKIRGRTWEHTDDEYV